MTKKVPHTLRNLDSPTHLPPVYFIRPPKIRHKRVSDMMEDNICVH